MNKQLHFNPKWRVIGALFFGLLFFLMGFGGILIERENLLSDTIRYLEKAGSYTALKESIKGRNTQEAVPVWSKQSGIKMIFCYPVTQSRIIERLKIFWSRDFDNFSEILFYPIPEDESWTDTVNQYTAEESRSVFLGYHPVVGRVNGVSVVKYELYIRIPASFMNTFPEEMIYTSFGENSFTIHREPAPYGPVFELTWEETQKSKQSNSVMDLPELVTEMVTRLNLLIGNGASLH